MRTVAELYSEVRRRFPTIAGAADRDYIRLYGQLEPEHPYSWFGSLANALNDEMRRGIAFDVHRPLFLFMDGAASAASDEVHQCIDVSFVENLFWSVPREQSSPYWRNLPPRLQKLYVDFHRHEP